MASIDALRAAHERAIGQNPVSIAGTRLVTMDDGAGGTITQQEPFGPFVGRLVPSRAKAQTVTLPTGSVQLAPWTLLAPWDAEPLAGDTFSAGGRSYRVRRVVPRQFDGQVWGYQTDLEEVS